MTRLLRRYRLVLHGIFVLLLLGMIVGLTWTNYRFVKQNPGGNDFLARWVGAHFWVIEKISPYDEQVSQYAQRMIYGHLAKPQLGEDVAHFVYPFHSMLFFAPFGFMNYDFARALWMTLLECAIVALAIISFSMLPWSPPLVERGVILLFSLLWYFSVRTIVVGQFAGLNALLIAAGLCAILRGKDDLGGVLLALSTAKPQMVYLIIPFVLIWSYSRRRWGVWRGFFATLTTLLTLSFLLLPGWLFQMLRQVMEYPAYTNRVGSVVSIMTNLIPTVGPALSYVFYAIFSVYLIVEWVLAWGKGERWFLWTALMTLVITNFVAFRTATTSYVAMLPAVFMIFFVLEDRWGRRGRIATMLLVLLLGVGVWWLFFATVEGNLEHAIMYLPLPIFCLIGLWWTRWWAVRYRDTRLW
ncbi:MAG: glycosyltransferase family 87 protein [Chloroflexota bacterium]